MEHDGHIVVAYFPEFGIKLIRHPESPIGTWDHLVFTGTEHFLYFQSTATPGGIDVVECATRKTVCRLRPPLVIDAIESMVNLDAEHKGLSRPT